MIHYTLDSVLKSSVQRFSFVFVVFFNTYLVLLIILCAVYTSELLREVTGSRLNKQMSDKWASGLPQTSPQSGERELERYCL